MKRLLFLILITTFIIAKILLMKASADLSEGLESGSQNVTLTGSTADYISGLDIIQLADNEVSVEMDLPSGWSMISLPVIPCNASVSSLFPEAKIVYGYEKGKGYVRVTENENLERGKGYWILLDQNQRCTLTGQPILSNNKTVKDKWEMIGGCSYSAKASTDGCNIGVIYDYVQGAGYQHVPGSQDLKPGKGYWILFRDFTFIKIPYIEFTSMDADFGEIVSQLDYTIVTSRVDPNPQEKFTFIAVDIEGQKKEISNYQERLLTFDEMTTDQRYAYNDFAQITKIKIAQARIFDPDNPRNRNKFLFWGKDSFDRYDSPWWVGETISEDNSEFKYTEYRIKPEKLTIIKPFMTIKSNKQFTLIQGPLPYFFEKLTLEENSILNTDGPVTIYVKRLILENKAKLMGGPGTDPDKASPNDLIILAECWPGSPCSKADDGIYLGSRAKICGHIFAPNLKVFLCKGYMGGDTRVYGSILTYQLVTSRCDAGASFGPIWIMYQEYIENLECDFELKVSN